MPKRTMNKTEFWVYRPCNLTMPFENVILSNLNTCGLIVNKTFEPQVFIQTGFTTTGKKILLIVTVKN